MQRPRPVDVYAALLEKEAQERRRIMRGLSPMHEIKAVGSAKTPCKKGSTGLLLTQETIDQLNLSRKQDYERELDARRLENPGWTPAVVAATPVATPVAAPVAKPAYRKDAGKAKRTEKSRSLSREDLAEAFALEKKEMTDAYLASIARQHRLQAELTKKKAELVALGLVKKGEVVPDTYKRHGVFLSFEVEHELLYRRHVAADAGNFLVLSREAVADPLSPWGGGMNALAREAMRLLIAEFAAEPSLREAAEEAVRGARREMRAERERIECGAYSAPAERPETPDAELKVERAEAAMESDYARHRRGWKPSLRPGRISSGGADRKPVHKGGSKAVSQQDAGVVVDPYMVVVAEKRQVADLIGPKAVARRVW